MADSKNSLWFAIQIWRNGSCFGCLEDFTKSRSGVSLEHNR